MPTSFDVLQIIADGNRHSGQELSSALGISRAAIWKHIQKLETQGLEIRRERGRGYRLTTALELLDEDAIFRQLEREQQHLLAELHIKLIADSTNALAVQGIGTSPSGSVWMAEHQTAGRGRRGRDWVSPFGANVYLSVLWKMSGGAAQLGGLSLALGVVLVEALCRLGIKDVALKWPNDLVHDGKKLGGILVEMQGDAAGEYFIIVGIGVNMKMPVSAGQSIDQQWTDLNQIYPQKLSRNTVAAVLTGAVLDLLANYPSTGFAAFAARWNALDALQNAAVVVRFGAETIAGVAQGAAADGALRLLTKDGLREFHGGEVSVRAQA